MTSLRRRRLSVALLRLGYRTAYRVYMAWSFVRRPRVRGTMCVISDDAGRVLLLRHTYGDRRAWELPGGWVRREEEPVEAARREAREELGADIDGWRALGALNGFWHYKHETLSFFAAEWPGGEPRTDPVEIAEIGWFDPRDPPRRMGDGTRAVVATLV